MAPIYKRWLALVLIVAAMAVAFLSPSRYRAVALVAPVVDAEAGAAVRLVVYDRWRGGAPAEGAVASARLVGEDGRTIRRWRLRTNAAGSVDDLLLPRDLPSEPCRLELRVGRWPASCARLDVQLEVAPLYRYSFWPDSRQVLGDSQVLLLQRHAVSGRLAEETPAPTVLLGEYAVEMDQELPGLSRLDLPESPPGHLEVADTASNWPRVVWPARMRYGVERGHSGFQLAWLVEGGGTAPGTPSWLGVYGADQANQPLPIQVEVDGQTWPSGPDGVTWIPRAADATDGALRVTAETPGGRVTRMAHMSSPEVSPVFHASLTQSEVEPGGDVEIQLFRPPAAPAVPVYLDVIADGQVVATHSLVAAAERTSHRVALPADVQGVVSLQLYSALESATSAEIVALAVLVQRRSAFVLHSAAAPDNGPLAVTITDPASPGEPVAGVVSLRLLSTAAEAEPGFPYFTADPALALPLTDNDDTLRFWLAANERPARLRHVSDLTYTADMAEPLPMHRRRDRLRWDGTLGPHPRPRFMVWHSTDPTHYRRWLVGSVLLVIATIGVFFLPIQHAQEAPLALWRLWRHRLWRDYDMEYQARHWPAARRLHVLALSLSVAVVAELAAAVFVVILGSKVSGELVGHTIVALLIIHAVCVNALRRRLDVDPTALAARWQPLYRACRRFLGPFLYVRSLILILAVGFSFPIAVWCGAAAVLWDLLLVLPIRRHLAGWNQRVQTPAQRADVPWRLGIALGLAFVAGYVWTTETAATYSDPVSASFARPRRGYRSAERIDSSLRLPPVDETRWAAIAELESGRATLALPTDDRPWLTTEIRLVTPDGRVQVWYLPRH